MKQKRVQMQQIQLKKQNQMIENAYENPATPLKQIKYKSFWKLALVVLNLCMSPFYFGYSLAYLSSIDFDSIIKIFSITIDKSLAQGLLIAFIPIGAGIGALSSSVLLKILSRRNCILCVNALAITVGLLIFVQNMYVLFVVRLAQGLCVGFYSSIIPLIIKEFSPVQISGTFGSFNQIFISLGVFFPFFFEYILGVIANDESGQSIWYYVFGLTTLTTLIQSINLLIFFPYETPKYLLLSDRQEDAKTLLAIIYKEQFVQVVLQEKKADMGLDTHQSYISQKNEKQNLSRTQSSSKTAIFVAMHLSLLQQFVGINSVVGYGGEIAGDAKPEMKKIFPIIINFQQVIAGLATSYMISKIGRKTILQFGTIAGTFSLALITIGFFVKERDNSVGVGFVLTGLILFMANFGLSLGPVVWLYIPEIVQPTIVPFSTLLNWIAAALVMFLFPIVKQNLPNQNPAPLFLFFGLWTLASFFINAKFMIETKGKVERQIVNEYSQLSLC